TLAIDSGSSKSLAFSPDGTVLVAPGFLWREPTRPTPGHGRGADEQVKASLYADRIGFTPSGRVVTAARGLLSIRARPGVGEPDRDFYTPVGHDSTINGFAFSPDESHLGVAYGNRVAAVWDLTHIGVPQNSTHYALSMTSGGQWRMVHRDPSRVMLKG